MNKLVTRGEIKKARYIKECFDLDVRKSPVIEGIELEPYIVKINGAEDWYQFNDGKFFFDEPNNEMNRKQLEEHKKVTELMEKEGKTEAEIREYMSGKGTSHIDRVECIIECKGLLNLVEGMIAKL